MFLVRNYVPNWTTTPPAPTIAPTTASIASTPLTSISSESHQRLSSGLSRGVFEQIRHERERAETVEVAYSFGPKREYAGGKCC